MAAKNVGKRAGFSNTDSALPCAVGTYIMKEVQCEAWPCPSLRERSIGVQGKDTRGPKPATAKRRIAMSPEEKSPRLPRESKVRGSAIAERQEEFGISPKSSSRRRRMSGTSPQETRLKPHKSCALPRAEQTERGQAGTVRQSEPRHEPSARIHAGSVHTSERIELPEC